MGTIQLWSLVTVCDLKWKRGELRAARYGGGCTKPITVTLLIWEENVKLVLKTPVGKETGMLWDLFQL